MTDTPEVEALHAIRGNLRDVRERIARAAERSGRDPQDITLIGVTKTHGLEAIAAAARAGLRDVGENRVQEAASKIDALPADLAAVRWHLVGHLQRNKVAAALDLFDILHSVDSERLAEAISLEAQRRQPPVLVNVLIEVNVSGESSKFGVAPRDVETLIRCVGRMPGISLGGLMTVAPNVDDPEDVRPVFRSLRELRDANGLRELSMGMTDDFEIAIAEGATMVRIGRAIFGSRQL